MSTVVIGANFGDEGKGLITDFETRRTGAKLVARFNGGAQAGHTVTTNDQRHVFGHVSSGTFAGADTYLSSKFILNPMVLHNELSALSTKPKIFAHANAQISTIFDMLLNAIVETVRGDKRHGSCGLGINETVTRRETLPILFGSINYVTLEQTIDQIKNQYVPRRLKELGIDEVPANYASLLTNIDVQAHANEIRMKLAAVQQRGDLDFMYHDGNITKNVIFEGAQGLMLDEFMGEFPHVTRSMTGLPYAIVAASELGVKELQPVYVTRSYLTRHGAGPLAHEGEYFGGSPVDSTNVENQWQQKLRYAPLNVATLSRFVCDDIHRAKFIGQVLGVRINTPTIAVTCLDQIDSGVVTYVSNASGHKVECNVGDLPQHISMATGLKISHVSRGPTAADVEYLDRSTAK